MMNFTSLRTLRTTCKIYMYQFSNLLALICCALLLSSFILPTAAQAQRVLPMIYELTPKGAGSQKTLRVENTSEADITVEFTSSVIFLDELGNETTQPAEDDFLIFPPQAIIKSGETQSIRVKYIGDGTLEASKAYRITVTQIPINFDDPQSESLGVGFTVSFGTLANVVPEKAAPKVAVTSVTPTSTGNWLVTLENTGNKYARLSQTEWKLVSGNNKKTLSSNVVGKITQKNLLLPSSTLKVEIPAQEGFSASDTDITVRMVK